MLKENQGLFLSFLSKLFFILSIIILFLFVEFLFRIYSPPLSRFGEVLILLEQDPVLLWKQRKYLNVNFQGVRVVTNSLGLRDNERDISLKKSSFRVICLGESSTFGWGVSFNECYPAQLKKRLENRFPGKNFEVINAGQIGYSSHQGLIFLRNYIVKYRPDIVTVPYLINDIDRYRFFRSNGLSDKELPAPNPLLIYLKNTLSKSKLYNQFNDLLLLNNKKKDNAAALKKLLRYSKVRVEPIDYRYNLETIYKLCKHYNIKVVFLKMPMNFRLNSPLEDEKNIFNFTLAKAASYFDSGEYDQAYKELKTALKYSPLSSKAYYYLGLYYDINRNSKEAATALRKAWDYQIYDVAEDFNTYGKIMEDVAKQYKIPLVNISDIFGTKKDLNLFDNPSDYIHPNAAGHRIIADELCDTLLKNKLIN